MNQSDAKAIVQRAWQTVHGTAPSDQETAFTQAVAWLENQYGRQGQFAALAANGQFNWGSLHASGKPPNCPPGSAPGSDVGAVCFQVFANDQDAAVAFVRTLTVNHGRSVVKAAMAVGPDAVAQAMYDTGYYQGIGATAADRVANYANAIRNAVSAIGAGAVVPDPKKGTGPGASGGGLLGALVVAGLVGGAAYWTFYRGGDRVLTHYFSQGLHAVRRLA